MVNVLSVKYILTVDVSDSSHNLRAVPFDVWFAEGAVERLQFGL